MLSFPKDDSRFSWTRHIKNKMVFYNLSPAEIKRIFSRPDRTEEGIAPNTIAAMRVKKSNAKAGPKATEIWLMYRIRESRSQNLESRTKNQNSKFSGLPAIGYRPTARVTLISAWRYPGRTKAGDRIPIPPEILEELQKIL